MEKRVGMQIGAATKEKRMEVTWKIKHRTRIWSTDSMSEKMKIQIQEIHTPIFIATLFTIAKTEKQPKYPLMGKLIKKLWYVCGKHIE